MNGSNTYGPIGGEGCNENTSSDEYSPAFLRKISYI